MKVFIYIPLLILCLPFVIYSFARRRIRKSFQAVRKHGILGTQLFKKASEAGKYKTLATREELAGWAHDPSGIGGIKFHLSNLLIEDSDPPTAISIEIPWRVRTQHLLVVGGTASQRGNVLQFVLEQNGSDSQGASIVISDRETFGDRENVFHLSGLGKTLDDVSAEILEIIASAPSRSWTVVIDGCPAFIDLVLDVHVDSPIAFVASVDSITPELGNRFATKLAFSQQTESVAYWLSSLTGLALVSFKQDTSKARIKWRTIADSLDPPKYTEVSVEQALFSPDEIVKMEEGRCLLLLPGTGAFMAKFRKS